MKASLVFTLLGILLTLAVASVAFQIVVAMGELEWEAGREEGLVEAIGVFGLGAALLLVVAVWALLGAAWSRRSRGKAMWLSIVPGILGLLVAIGAALVFALNDGQEEMMAVILPLAYGLGPLLLVLAGWRARRALPRTTAPSAAA